MNGLYSSISKQQTIKKWEDQNRTFFPRIYTDGHQAHEKILNIANYYICCCSVTKLCQTLCDLMDCSTPDFLVLHHLPELAQTHVRWITMPSNHLILCRSLLLLPSVFPNIRVFSNESALHVRWLKFWSFSFSISPSNEHSGLISFRTD